MALSASLAKLRSPAVLVAQNGTSTALPNYMVDEVEQSRASIVAAMCSSSALVGHPRRSYPSGSQPWDSAGAEEVVSSPVEQPHPLTSSRSRPSPSLIASSRVAPASPRVLSQLTAAASCPDAPATSAAAAGSDCVRCGSMSRSPRTSLQPTSTTRPQTFSPSTTCRQNTSASDSTPAATRSSLPTAAASESFQAAVTRRPLSASASTAAQVRTGAMAHVAADTDLLAAVTGRASHQPCDYDDDDDDSFDEEELEHDLDMAHGTLARALEMARGTAAPTLRAGAATGAADGSAPPSQRPNGVSGARRPTVKVVSVEISPASSFSSQQAQTPGSARRPSVDAGGPTVSSSAYRSVGGAAGWGAAGASILDRSDQGRQLEGAPAANSGAGSGGRYEDRWSVNSASSVNTRTVSGITASAASNYSPPSCPRGSRLSSTGHGASCSQGPSPRQGPCGALASPGNSAGETDLEAASPENSATGGSRKGIGRFAAGNPSAPAVSAPGRAIRHSGGGGGSGSLKGLLKLAKKAFRRSTGSRGSSGGGGGLLDGGGRKGASHSGATAPVDPAQQPGSPVGRLFENHTTVTSSQMPGQTPPLLAPVSPAAEAAAYTRNHQPAARPQWAQLSTAVPAGDGRLSPHSPTQGPPSPLSPFTISRQMSGACAGDTGGGPAPYLQAAPRSPVALPRRTSCEGSEGGSGVDVGAGGSAGVADGGVGGEGSGSRRFASYSSPAYGDAGVPAPAAGAGIPASPAQRRRYSNLSSGYSGHPVSELQVAAHVQSFLQHQQQAMLQQQQQQLLLQHRHSTPSASSMEEQGPQSQVYSSPVPAPDAAFRQGPSSAPAVVFPSNSNTIETITDAGAVGGTAAGATPPLALGDLPLRSSVDFTASRASAPPGAGAGAGAGPAGASAGPAGAASATGGGSGWQPVRWPQRHMPHRANALASDPFLSPVQQLHSALDCPRPPQPPPGHQPALGPGPEAGACCDTGSDDEEDVFQIGRRPDRSALEGITCRRMSGNGESASGGTSSAPTHSGPGVAPPMSPAGAMGPALAQHCSVDFSPGLAAAAAAAASAQTGSAVGPSKTATAGSDGGTNWQQPQHQGVGLPPPPAIITTVRRSIHSPTPGSSASGSPLPPRSPRASGSGYGSVHASSSGYGRAVDRYGLSHAGGAYQPRPSSAFGASKGGIDSSRRNSSYDGGGDNTRCSFDGCSDSRSPFSDAVGSAASAAAAAAAPADGSRRPTALVSEASTASTGGGWQPMMSPADCRRTRGSDTGSSAPSSPLRPPTDRPGAPRPPPAAPSVGAAAGGGNRVSGSGSSSSRLVSGSGTAAVVSGRSVGGAGAGDTSSHAGSPVPRRLAASAHRVAVPADEAAAAVAAVAAAATLPQLSSFEFNGNLPPPPPPPMTTAAAAATGALLSSPLRAGSSVEGTQSHRSPLGSSTGPSSPLLHQQQRQARGGSVALVPPPP